MLVLLYQIVLDEQLFDLGQKLRESL